MPDGNDLDALRLLVSFGIDVINQGEWSRPTEREELIAANVRGALERSGGDAAAALMAEARMLAGEDGTSDWLGLRRDGFDLPPADEVARRVRTGCLFLFRDGVRHTYYGEDPYAAGRPSVSTVIDFLNRSGPAF